MPSSLKPKELTIRGLILGALITTVFTAANVYLGLKVGLTFASSIPAAVISMAVLSAVKDSTILENNIVQTVASAAGTLSAIIFVLPGLVEILPSTTANAINPYLPSNAGGTIAQVFADAHTFSAWGGFALFCGYTVAVIAIAATLLLRRDV